jgi:hypothetical protein
MVVLALIFSICFKDNSLGRIMRLNPIFWKKRIFSSESLFICVLAIKGIGGRLSSRSPRSWIIRPSAPME